jgi:hypothetical protein
MRVPDGKVNTHSVGILPAGLGSGQAIEDRASDEDIGRPVVSEWM